METWSWRSPGLMTLGILLQLGGPIEAGGQELPEGVTQEMVEEGKVIFDEVVFCVDCHGETGKGTDLGPDLTDDVWLHIGRSFEEMVELIETGVPQPQQHMMPMKPRGGGDITDEQVRAVAAYVWTLSQGDGDGGASPIPALQN